MAFFGHPNGSHFLNRFFNLAIDVADVTVFILVGTNKFITVEVFLRMFTVSTRFQNLAFFSNPNSSHFLDWFFNLAINVSCITIFVLIGANKFITVKVFLRLFTICTRLQDFTFLRHPDSSHFLDWFFNLAVDVSGITIFVLVGTNEVITVEVFLRMFTISTRFQNLAFFSHPDSSHFFDRFVHVSGITIFVLVGTNEFITVKVFFRMFTIGTRLQHLTFFSYPNRRHLLDRFFNRTVDVCCITIFVLVGANEFITIKVFFWLFTICTRFQNLTFFSNPNSSYFLDRFFNRTVNVSSITIFILVGANEFITVKVFFWFLAICTWFQHFTSYRYPNGGHLFDGFFNRTIDVSGDRTIHFCFHKLVTWECVLRFEVWCHNRSLQCCPCHSNPSCGFQFCHRTFLNRERRNLCRCYLWCLWFDRRSCCRICWVLRLWTVWGLWFFRFFTSFWSRFFWFFTSFRSWWCWRGCWWCIWRYRRSNGWFLWSYRFFRFDWFVWNRCRTFRRFHRFSRFDRRFWFCWFNRNRRCEF